MERKIEKVVFATPLSIKLKRVAAYARVSTGKDAMMHSLSAQISYYSGLIQSHPGWKYCGVYSDEAFTGTKDARPGFLRMLEDCRGRKIDMLIVKSISRFARNTVTLLETVRELRGLAVDVFFEEQNIHTLSSEGELMLTILASFAQAESLSASENMKWRVRTAFEKGELFTLRNLYGYSIKRGEIRPDPQTSAVVREIFNRAALGETFREIADGLNRRGVSAPVSGIWKPEKIADILSNEKYSGNALLMKKYRNNHLEKKKVVNRGEKPMYYAEGTHEAIVDPETFSLASEVLKRNNERASGRNKRTKPVLSGRILCGKCGKNYRRSACHGIVFWNCGTYIERGKSFCEGGRIREDDLMRIIEETARIEDVELVTVMDGTVSIKLKNGETFIRTVEQTSRSASWTPEKREAAKERAINQWRNR